MKWCAPAFAAWLPCFGGRSLSYLSRLCGVEVGCCGSKEGRLDNHKGLGASRGRLPRAHTQANCAHSVRCTLCSPTLPAGEPRIKAEAAARGIDPARVIFTDVAAKPVHIRRSGLADVFLDTPLCNAHTTGGEAAW